MKTNNSISVSVIGASGYSGTELVRLLSRHPQVKLVALGAHSSVGKSFSDFSLNKGAAAIPDFSTNEAAANAQADVTFVALPSGESIQVIGELAAKGKTVIDLGGDFRLRDLDDHKKYYKHEHPAHELTASATYGLSEFNRSAIASATLVANPGCYATGIILPLAPLVKASAIETSGIVINSLSGVSGAGKKQSIDYSFTELNDSIHAYRIGEHQHTPEIRQAIKDFASKDISFTFVPHLAPITRGIHTTIVAPLATGVTAEQINEIYHEQFSTEPFIALSGAKAPALRRVQQTNMAEIGWVVDTHTNSLVVLSTIDNLLKGAAGQAVQNMNIRFGFEETLGL